MQKSNSSYSGLLKIEKTSSSIKYINNVNDNSDLISIENNSTQLNRQNSGIIKLKQSKKIEKKYIKKSNQYDNLSKEKNDVNIYNNKKFCSSNNNYKKINKKSNNELSTKPIIDKSNKVISSIKISHDTFYNVVNKRDVLKKNINNLVINTNQIKNDNNIYNNKHVNSTKKSLNLIDIKNNSYTTKMQVTNIIINKKNINLNPSLSQELINKKIQLIKTTQRINSSINNTAEKTPDKFDNHKNNSQKSVFKNKNLKKNGNCLNHNNIIEKNIKPKKHNNSNSINQQKIHRKKNFQKIFFNITNIKFKHILILFLDQKSITLLSSLNKTFHKNLRSNFYVYIFDKLLSAKNKIFVKKILRSVFNNSTYVISKNYYNKNEFFYYYKSIKFPNPKYNDVIIKDLPRTFPDDQNFSPGGSSYNKLYNLLSSYSNFNKNIGYVQGLNFLFGNAIYLFGAEDEIFLFIDGMINLLQLDKYLCINNQTDLPNKMKEFKEILEKYVPEIVGYFNMKFLGVEFFTTSWFLTLFSTSMKIKNLIICWCFMILFGWKFFYSFVIQILVKYQDIIFNAEDRELCYKTKNILHSKEFIRDFNEICSKTMQFMKEHITL